MAAAAKKTAPLTFSWTDDEVELLLKVTNEYKVSKTADNVDWESVQKKYSDILDRFKNELEKASGSSGKDYPHKREEITKQCLTNKLKSIRLKYRQAVDTGKRSGHGRVVLLYYDFAKVFGEDLQQHSSLQAALKVEISQQLWKHMVMLI